MEVLFSNLGRQPKNMSAFSAVCSPRVMIGFSKGLQIASIKAPGRVKLLA